MNKFLCWVSSYTNLPPQSIVTMLGESCNNGGQAPINNYYRYTGNTMYPIRQALVFYLTPANSDPQTAFNFTSLFISPNLGALMSPSAKAAANLAGVNYIDRGFYYGEENLINLQNPISVPVAILRNAVNTRDGRILIPAANSPGPGTVYLVIIPSTDPKPSAAQVLNCRNGNNNQVTICNRIALTGNEANEVSIIGANSNQDYMLYYTTANPYPIRPINNGVVSQLSVSKGPINIPKPAGPNKKI